MLGIGFSLLAASLTLFRIRNILPVGVIKLGVSLFQIVASSSTSYAIPWYDVDHSGPLRGVPIVIGMSVPPSVSWGVRLVVSAGRTPSNEPWMYSRCSSLTS